MKYAEFGTMSKIAYEVGDRYENKNLEMFQGCFE